jgi:hypothetical protein
MSQTSRFIQERIISVPKHLLKYRDEVSPYGKIKEFKNPIGSRVFTNTKKIKSGLTRGLTFPGKSPEDEMANLITVERNYVRKMIKSPLRPKSKSPLIIPTHKNIIANKSKLITNRFESLTACDFLGFTTKRKNTDIRKIKCSFTPELFNKRK